MIQKLEKKIFIDRNRFKGVFPLLGFALLLFSCSVFQDSPKNGEDSDLSVLGNPDPAHNAQNSLDYLGSYKGIIPCEDCEGIEIQITLREESQFQMKRTFLKKDNGRELMETGEFEWNEKGNTIRLVGTSPPIQLFVAENRLIYLGRNGSKLEEGRANKYILLKVIR